MDAHRSWFENAPDAILVIANAQVRDANAAAAELFGRPIEALVGCALAAVLGDAEALLAASAAGERGGGAPARGRAAVVRRGEPRALDWSLATNVEPGVHLVTLRDVTEQRRREETWERYRLLSEQTPDIVLFVRKDGSILEANEAAARAYGRPREQIVGMNVRDLRAPETQRAVSQQVQEAFARGLIFETLHVRRDGSTFPVEVSSRSARVGGEDVLLSIIRDLTERNAMQARLLQADRMAAVGTLAAGVAHEINNPLAYALTNLEVLGRTLARLRRRLAPFVDTEPSVAHDLELAEQVLAVAREGTERVRAIVRDLKTFSRVDDAARGPIDVRAVLDSCINMAAAELRHRARLVREYHDVPAVEASESRVAQVFLNLLVNAAQALDPARAERNEIRIATATNDAGDVVVEVEDNGVGMTSALKERVFEPFVTTKPVGEGTGLGLFISREIVTALGGTIHVDSEVGVGTRMRVTLPAGAPRAVPSAAPGREAGDRERARRILVVDDEDSIGLSVRRALEDELRVVIATSGREAVSLLEADRDFDVVLCDVVMPDLDGLGVHAAVAKLDPALADRFVFMTGGVLTAETRELLASKGDGRGRLLEKPFQIEHLRELLRQRMAKARAS